MGHFLFHFKESTAIIICLFIKSIVKMRNIVTTFLHMDIIFILSYKIKYSNILTLSNYLPLFNTHFDHF